MPLSLPRPIADYFTADATDGATVAEFFIADAVVVDENRIHRGRAEITRWKAEASAKYDYESVPVALENKGDRIVLTAHLTGNFPGSPVDLRYAFTLAGNAIARLEIVL